MKAAIKLDVPEWQIGQPVTVFFKDTMEKHGVCEADQIVMCKDCIHWDKGHSEECDNSDSVCFHNGWCKPDWFCADGEKRTD